MTPFVQVLKDGRVRVYQPKGGTAVTAKELSLGTVVVLDAETVKRIAAAGAGALPPTDLRRLYAAGRN